MSKRRTRPTLAINTKQTSSRVRCAPITHSMPRLMHDTKAQQDLTLQAYIQLSTQKDNIQNRLAFASPSATVSPVSAPSPTNLFSLSPVKSLGSPLQPNNYHSSISSYLSSSQPIAAMPHPGLSMPTAQSDMDEDRLAEVNHQIKATLTELLNHESVRHDDSFRHWVQERLMEAEAETRKQRRRSRRRSSIDREAVSNSIAESIRGPDVFRFGTTL